MARIPCDVTPYTTGGLATKGCVNAKTKKATAAFAYLSFVCGPEGQKLIAEAGSKPALVTDETKKILSQKMGLSEACPESVSSNRRGS